MNSRMEKYYDNHEQTRSRMNKNEHLYKEINEMDVEKYNPNNNVKVIGDNDHVIDVDKIKNLLEKNYKDLPRRKEIKIEPEKEENVLMEETKEYNINSILEKAREEKEVDYNKERLKKVRDTQFDILNNLQLEQPREEEESKKNKEKELMTLINTITSKELEKKDSLDPLDILTDLKGDDDTKVLSTLQEKAEVKDPEESKSKKLENSFYTTTNAFTKSDFDDFNDLKEDLKATKIIIRVLIFFIILAFIIGTVFFINNFFDLQIF